LPRRRTGFDREKSAWWQYATGYILLQMVTQ
jgi:hypothetical protein